VRGNNIANVALFKPLSR